MYVQQCSEIQRQEVECGYQGLGKEEKQGISVYWEDKNIPGMNTMMVAQQRACT